jgi:PilZ domain-containing protein
MSHEDERRRHMRYALKLPITLHRDGQQISAHVINASEGGCLLQLAQPLEMGEVLEASIPAMGVPRTMLYVLRCQATADGDYTVATRFEEESVVDSASLAWLSRPQ